MAPKTSGIKSLDHGNIMRLAKIALEFSQVVLKKNGKFLVKVLEFFYFF
jgi:23S rRNA U2552 (ribose-2'-O)-methylase RlmE/FtsJ